MNMHLRVLDFINHVRFQFLNSGIGGTSQMAKESLFASICKWSWQWTCFVHWRQGWISHFDWTFAFWCLDGMIQGALINLISWDLRLRAAVFVNFVAMRQFMSNSDNGVCTLSAKNLRGLQQANYLYHAAINSFLSWLYIGCLRCMCLLRNDPHKVWHWSLYILRNFVGKFGPNCISILADTSVHWCLQKFFSGWSIDSFFEVGPCLPRHGTQNEPSES